MQEVQMHLTLMLVTDRGQDVRDGDQVGGLTRALGPLALLPQQGDEVDVLGVGDAPEDDSYGGYPLASVHPGTWEHDLSSVQVALMMPVESREYCQRVTQHLVKQGWVDWFNDPTVV